MRKPAPLPVSDAGGFPTAMRGLPPKLLLLLRRRLRHASSRLGLFASSTGREDESSWWECLGSKFCHQLSDNSSVEHITVQETTVSYLSAYNETGGFETESPPDELEDVKNVYKIVVPVMLTACLISMIFNLTIVGSVRWIRRNLSPTMYLSLSLAMADAYTSLVVGLGLIVNSLLPHVYNRNLGPFNTCYILVLEAFRLGGVVVAVLHLLALAVNHYIGILRPLHYAATVTRRTAIGAIAVMWLLPVAFFLTYFSCVPNDGFQSDHCSSYEFLLYKPFRLITSLLFFVPLVMMCIMYIHMFIVVRRHQRGLQQLPSTRHLHKNVKAVITTLLILGTYVLGWMPAVLYFILTCLDCPIPFSKIHLWVRVPIGIFSNSMIVLKSFVDPIIYVVRMPEIKTAFRIIWRTKCGSVIDETDKNELHSRTDIHRMTLLRLSRKSVKQNNWQNNA